MKKLLREYFIIAKEDKIINLVKSFAGKIELSYVELMERANTHGVSKGGAFTNALSDAKTMSLISNGGKRYTITESGQRLASQPTNRELWKEVYLIPFLYQEYNKQFPNVSDYHNFMTWAYENYAIKKGMDRVVSMAIRRFLEGYYQLKLAPKLGRFRKKEISTENIKNQEFAVNTSNLLISVDEYISLQKVLKELKDKHGKENIIKILEL